MSTETLFPAQHAVLEHGIIDLGYSSVLSLPTGSGKTTLAEMAMERTLGRGERVAYLTPLKALAEEKITEWTDRWSQFKVGIFTGDYDTSTTPVAYQDAEVLICTYERLDLILRHWQRHLHWLSLLGLVVVDEFHLLMDPSRGSRLEGAISRLQRVNPFCRIMGLSATVSNHAELAKWLNGVSYHSAWRPVPLMHEVRRFKRLSDKPILITDIVAETAAEGGQSLVFASSRRRAEQLAAQVSSAGYPCTHHHAGLGLARRRAVEADFRKSKLTCLVATPTLEMGLNLPCRTVIIADSTRWADGGFEPLPIWSYLQRAGRAGRPGQQGPGRAVLLAPTWARQLPDYARAAPEPIRSHLSGISSLAEQVLIEVASRSCRTRAQLSGSFLPSTLAYQQDPSILDRFPQCIDELIAAGIIKEDDFEVLHPTPAGWVAVRHQLSPATTCHLLALAALDRSRFLTDFDLLLHHCWDPQLQPQLPVSIEVVDALEDLIRSIPSHLLDSPPPATMSPRACAAGVLMAVVAWQYTQGQDPREICERLDIYPSDGELLQESLVRLLAASADLHAAMDPAQDRSERRQHEQICGPSLVSTLRRLALQLEHGLPGDSAFLTRINGCGGRLARRLLEAGIADLEDLCQQEPDALTRIPGIGAKRAQTWVEQACELIKESHQDRRDLPVPRPRSVAAQSDWPHDIDPGRLQRALTLTVSGNASDMTVSGGAEEHRTRGDTCDCADFARHAPGWWCKHRLAVRLANNDKRIKILAGRLAELQPPPTLAGHLADLVLGRRWLNG